VIDEALHPGEQHGEHAEGTTDPVQIAAQFDDCLGGGLHQAAVAVALAVA
jgi:hypothetical protein